MVAVKSPQYQNHKIDRRFVELIEGHEVASCSLSCAQEQLSKQGFILLKGALNKSLVSEAFLHAEKSLVACGEAAAATTRLIATGESRRGQFEDTGGQFWSQATRHPAVVNLAHGDEMRSLVEKFAGVPMSAERAIYFRCVGPGQGTSLHVDYPCQDYPPTSTLKCWAAVTGASLERSCIFFLETQGRLNYLRSRSTQAADKFRTEDLLEFNRDPNRWLEISNAKLFTAEAAPGDLFIFSVMTPHASFDNCDSLGRYRVSCDVGWQCKFESIPSHIGHPPEDPDAYTGFVGSGPRCNVSRLSG